MPLTMPLSQEDAEAMMVRVKAGETVRMTCICGAEVTMSLAPKGSAAPIMVTHEGGDDHCKPFRRRGIHPTVGQA